MSWQQAEVVATVVGTLLAVVALVRSFRRSAKDQAERDQSERDQIRDTAYKAGRDSRDDEVRQLTGQLGDARYQRDQAVIRATDYEQRYNDLRDNRRRT